VHKKGKINMKVINSLA